MCEDDIKELSRKLSGYSIPERYSGFYLLSAAVCGISLLAAITAASFSGIGISRYLIIGSLFVWVADWIVLTILTRRSDRLEIQKVLKGGI